jgi:hypothetical protein
MLQLRRPLLVGVEDAALRLVTGAPSDLYDQFRCGARLDSFSGPTLKQCWQWLARPDGDGYGRNKPGSARNPRPQNQ